METSEVASDSDRDCYTREGECDESCSPGHADDRCFGKRQVRRGDGKCESGEEVIYLASARASRGKEECGDGGGSSSTEEEGGEGEGQGTTTQLSCFDLEEFHALLNSFEDEILREVNRIRTDVDQYEEGVISDEVDIVTLKSRMALFAFHIGVIRGVLRGRAPPGYVVSFQCVWCEYC